MIKIEKVSVYGFDETIRGMRNPMNSWDKSDSGKGCDGNLCVDCGFRSDWCGNTPKETIGENDHDLMMRLAGAGKPHSKYRRMINVYLDIVAPLYWWKEFDTYKVGTVANSCSTMHKIHAKEFTKDDFSCEHLISNYGDEDSFPYTKETDITVSDYEGLQNFAPMDILERWIIPSLNKCREKYLTALKTEEETGFSAKDIWYQMIQLLPSSYNQRRTVMLNYEVLNAIYYYRKHHKLDEWREFCKWIETLPYSELITCNGCEEDKKNG